MHTGNWTFFDADARCDGFEQVIDERLDRPISPCVEPESGAKNTAGGLMTFMQFSQGTQQAGRAAVAAPASFAVEHLTDRTSYEEMEFRKTIELGMLPDHGRNH